MQRALVAAAVTLSTAGLPLLAFACVRFAPRPLDEMSLAVGAGIVGLSTLVVFEMRDWAGFTASLEAGRLRETSRVSFTVD